ncbi:MAG: Sporulation initiation phosphotransferase F [Pelotomaculum sp. PtaB.Bin104]|nr:MAG: Sporulation initiation phosphotransferase F [Pelotomaculum sp. PtaB.Bin104]
MKREPLDILIVDDQPGVRHLLEIIVKELGHNAHTARNGLEAVSLTYSIHPGLIFMDIRMPLMDGLEALGQIKTFAPGTKVVIMTALGSEETVAQAMQIGALGCIAKPFDIDEIKEFMEKIYLEQPNLGATAASS